MLRPNGAVVLIDFGLVKNLAAYTRSTAAGVLRGSPYYMSPEQAQGQELDQRTDLYSLGVILYEMLIGRKPYSGTTAVELMHQHVHGPRPALPPELAAFEALVEGLMACERGDRFRDAAAAVDAIAAVLNASSEDRAGVQVECVDAV
jgi:serine/threonine-protein kinase PpkA